MKFKVFFQATGVVVVNAKSQAEAEAKSEDLADEQVAEAIDHVEILDVVNAGKKSGPAAD